MRCTGCTQSKRSQSSHASHLAPRARPVSPVRLPGSAQPSPRHTITQAVSVRRPAAGGCTEPPRRLIRRPAVIQVCAESLAVHPSFSGGHSPTALRSCCGSSTGVYGCWRTSPTFRRPRLDGGRSCPACRTGHSKKNEATVLRRPPDPVSFWRRMAATKQTVPPTVGTTDDDGGSTFPGVGR